MSKASRNRDIARARVAEMRALEARKARQRRLFMWAGAAVLAIAAVVAIVLAVTSGRSHSPQASHGQLNFGPISALGPLKPPPSQGGNGFEGVPIPPAPPLAGRAAAATGSPVNGIRCQTQEQLVFHIHSHLTIFINGAQRQIPAGIGIPGSQPQQTSQGQVAAGGSCLYWLHTHAPDGIIHVESPIHRTYTLGDFFDEWGQPLGPSQLGPVRGHVVAIYNGKVYRGNPRNIPLNAHAQIQLQVGKPLIAPVTITFPNGL
ncbi:MAG: hypothetical protein ACTHJW_28145 [Streptosporangiaceae bacterium]